MSRYTGNKIIHCNPLATGQNRLFYTANKLTNVFRFTQEFATPTQRFQAFLVLRRRCLASLR
jgi:hypothetical protein